MSQGKRVWFEEAGGVLDPGLVEELRRLRKTDPIDQTLIPVIVSLQDNIKDEHKNHLLQTCQKDPHSSIEGQLDIIGAVHGHLHPEMIRQIKDYDAVNRIYYDRKVTALLDVATREIGAVDVQKNLGYTGKGVTIAVIDTGIYPHDDLTKPNNRIIAFKDFINNQEEPYDDQGHGTHCSGDAAGNGNRSEGRFIGPASEASLVGVKVLDKDGSGQLSTIIEAISWCIQQKDDLNIRVISMSLGAPAFESYRDDPLAQAVEKAWHNGITVCAAAGNSGPYPFTISTPGIDPLIITVGAMDDENTLTREDDEVARYSSRGPTIDLRMKPDIYSPGTDITSLTVPGSPLEKELPEQLVGEDYIRLSGTSMATPITAGVVALMLEANPYLSPNDVKSILVTTAQPLSGVQPGYIQAKAAVEMAKSYPRYQEALIGAKSVH